jgi:hypothetical protein
MYLIRKKSDNTIVYAFHEKPVIGRCLKYPLVALDITSDTHEIIKENTPKDFVAGAYTYDKEWKVKHQSLIDEVNAEKEKPDPKQEAISELAGLKKDQEGKSITMAYLDKRLSAIEKILGVN